MADESFSARLEAQNKQLAKDMETCERCTNGAQSSKAEHIACHGCVYEIFLWRTGEVFAVSGDNIETARRAMTLVAARMPGNGFSLRRVFGSIDDEKYSGMIEGRERRR